MAIPHSQEGLIYYALSLPAEARAWCEIHDLRCHQMFADDKEWIVVYFNDEKSASHYKRRWHGRVGRDYRGKLRGAVA